jgi:hypothetical protein
VIISLIKGCPLLLCHYTLACENGHIKIAELLLKNGATLIHETTIDLDTDFYYHPDVNTEDPETLNLRTYKYSIALICVAIRGVPSTIDYLISCGADIHQLALGNETLMKTARRSNNKPVIEHLKKLGLDFNKVKG